MIDLTFVFYLLNSTSKGGFGDSLKGLINNLLSFDPKVFAAHVIASILIILCIVWWFWKPTNNFIKRNKEILNKTYKELIVANKESQRYLKLLKQENESMINIKTSTIEKVKKDAESIINNAKKSAKEESKIILETAINKAKVLEETAHSVIRNSVVQLSIDLTKKLVGENINEESTKKIIDSYIEEVESKSITDDYK